MTSDHQLVDALPYIDMGFEEPGVREAVLEMVSEETRRYKATKNYLDNLSQLNLKDFETDLMRTELERLHNRQPMDMLSMKRYELPGPPAGKMTDLSAWNESVANSMAQLQHQSIRIDNLELMQRLGSEGWKQYNETLTQMQSNAQKDLQELRKHIQEVNWFRKSSQMAAGDKIKHLESEWVSLVAKNYEIERQCLHLELEISEMERKLNVNHNNESNVETNEEESDQKDE
ncbi:unnamed protein product [Medioppia subpectinata]|uniref:Pre-mRNA-splicing factor SPF27 n=1 Tax=Medioppia subpectinata TaxID=1979941 RepID=A0A7R9LJH2_9ACAR|nr:unnamed protein product [Medioppia subpectinata]CAG2119034.1 unnamed protein product [Medioppia subpectinata]